MLSIVCALLAGCGTATPPRALPAGIIVSVTQNRTDFAPRLLEIVVENGTDAEIDVRAASFDSPEYVAAAVWPKDGTTIRAGATAALPVPLAAADCTVDDPSPVVTLTLRTGSSDPVEVTTVPADPLDRLPALHSEDCLRDAVDTVAVISAVTVPRLRDVSGTPVADLDVSIEPTGASGSIMLEDAVGTTLFAVADEETAAVLPDRPLGIRVSASDEPSIVTLTLVPNRCDAHAVAEDKRGTIFPLHVTIGDGADAASGVISITSSDEVKGALLDYLAGACG